VASCLRRNDNSQEIALLCEVLATQHESQNFPKCGHFFVTFREFKRLIYVEKATDGSGKKKRADAPKEKGQAVDSRDEDIIGHKARCETEAFINQHIHDRAKGWPVSCRFGADSTGSGPVQQVIPILVIEQRFDPSKKA
jgi:hypothetical protein